MILLDTTVLVYAKGADHPLRSPCRRLIAAIADMKIEASTTAEVIQEFVHVRSRRRDRTDAAALGRDYAEILSPLTTVTADDLTSGLAIFERNDALGAFDAVLAACAARTEARALVSADNAFGGLPEIPHVTPDHNGLSTLLAEG